MGKSDSGSKEYLSLFEDFYRKNLHKMEYYANYYLNDMEEARSVTQDAFLTLWEKRGEIDFSKDLLPYLIIVTKNKTLNVLRKRKSTSGYLNYLKNREDQLCHDALNHDSSNLLYSNEISLLFKKAIDNMSPKVKETYILSKINHFKNREIAEIQKISITTVEYRLSCAFRLLYKIFKDYMKIILWLLPFIGLY